MFGIFKQAATHQHPRDNSSKYEIWMEGNPSQMETAKMIGYSYGSSFNLAVKRYVNLIRGPSSTMWTFDPVKDQWSFLGRKVFDNEQSARADYG